MRRIISLNKCFFISSYPPFYLVYVYINKLYLFLALTSFFLNRDLTCRTFAFCRTQGNVDFECLRDKFVNVFKNRRNLKEQLLYKGYQSGQTQVKLQQKRLGNKMVQMSIRFSIQIQFWIYFFTSKSIQICYYIQFLI